MYAIRSYYEPLESTIYFKPTNRQALASAIALHPKAKLIAGGTDLSLEVTQQLKSLPELIDRNNFV